MMAVQPDLDRPALDVGRSNPDAATVQLDAATSERDAGRAVSDAGAARPDADLTGRDASSSPMDGALPQPDAEPISEPRTPSPDDPTLGTGPSDAAYAGGGSVYTVDFEPDGTFSMQGEEAGGERVSATGTYNRLYGFLRLTIVSSEGPGAPAVGTTTWAMELPGHTTFIQWPTEGQSGLIPMLLSGVCPEENLSLNWLKVGSLETSAYDHTAEALGLFRVDLGMWTSTIEDAFSVALTVIDRSQPEFAAQACDPSELSLEVVEDGQRIANLFLSGESALVQPHEQSGTVLALQGSETTQEALTGVYAGFMVQHRESTGARQRPGPVCGCGPEGCGPDLLEGEWTPVSRPVRVVLGTDGRMKGQVFTDLEAGTVQADLGFTIELSTMNQPHPGFATGTFSNGSGQGQIACSVTTGVGHDDAQVLLVCLAQPPGYARGAPAQEIILASLPGFSGRVLPPPVEPVEEPRPEACGRDMQTCLACCESAFQNCQDEQDAGVPGLLSCWPARSDCDDACVADALPEIEETDCVAPNELNPIGRIVYVEQNGGDDSNDGLAFDSAVATVSRGAELLQAGDILLVGPGTYYEHPVFNVPGTGPERPVWIKARCVGKSTITGAWREAAEGLVEWEDEGNGVYSAPYHIAPLYGSYEGVLLFRHMRPEELVTNRLAINQGRIRTRYGIDAVTLPPYGISYDRGGQPPFLGDGYQNGRVYVRLPGDLNPNGHSVLLSRASRNERGNGGVLTVSQTPYLILDGFRIEGAGQFCVDALADSPGITIRNVNFAFCTIGARLPDNSLVEWSEFSIPGLSELIEQVRCLNEDGERAFFVLVKGHHDGSGAWIEGGLGYGRPICGELGECQVPPQEGARSPTGAEFRYNYVHNNFDGEKLGTFEFSESHHNVYYRNFDNHIELEGANFSDTRELQVHDSLFLSCPSGPISHQSDFIVGPHYVYRNVVHAYDDLGYASWTQIKAMAPNAEAGIFYYHNLFYGGEFSLFPQGTAREHLHFQNNIIIADDNPNRGNRTPLDADHNIVVNRLNPDVDLAFLAGPNGLQANLEDLMFRSEETLDFSLMPGSVAAGRGLPLPDRDGGDEGDVDIGPFPMGVQPGPDWPRPRRTTYTTDLPDRWPQPSP